jgi:hypothetical protein
MPTLLETDDMQKLQGLLGEFKTTYTKLEVEYQKLGQGQSETFTKLQKLTDDYAELHTQVQEKAVKRIDDLEAKLNRRQAEMEPPKSIGQQVVDDPGFQTAIKQRGGRLNVTVSVKGPLWLARLGIKQTAISLSEQWPQRLSEMGLLPRPPIGVRTLIPPGRTSAGSVEYVEETSWTNAAAPVAPGAAKPESQKVFTIKTGVVRTLATWFKTSWQTLDDMPFLVSQIENNGVWGVQVVEDSQLLNGNGTAPNLQGMMPVAAAAPAPPAGSNLVDAIGKAVFDLAAKGYMPDGTVVNPSDWGNVAMLKNSQGNYLFANPMDYQPNPRVWGTRVVQTANMAASNFLVGAFQGNTQLLDREDVHVQLATQNEDDFIKNLITILIEERVVLVLYQPGALEKGVVPAAP